MGRGGGRGPQQLRFRTLLEKLVDSVDLIPDRRRETSVGYSLQDCYRSSYAMFYLQDPSLLEFQRRDSTGRHANIAAGQVAVRF